MKFQFNYLTLVFVITASLSGYAKVLPTEGTVCIESVCRDYKPAERLPVEKNAPNIAVYKFKFNIRTEECFYKRSCYLFLGAIGDTFKLEINGNVVVDEISTTDSFIYQASTRNSIPPSFLTDIIDVKITVKDLNGTLFGLLTNSLFVGTEQETFRAQSIDWIVRTGVTLFSAYTLAMLSLIVFLLLFIKYDHFILMIFLYCLSAGLYLISFSEYPRRLSPELLSGHVHFFLRLLQDLCLFVTFQVIFTNSFRTKGFFRVGILLYSLFLILFPMFYIFGKSSYDVAKNIIYIGAPLVALPMGYALYLAKNLPKGFERSLLVPLTGLLFLLQFHDLLLFWQLIHSYFMVKFYIPFVVMLLLYIQIRRYADDYSEKARISEKDIIVKQVIHDIKSPVGALMVVIEKARLDGELRELADMAVTRMRNLIKILQFESSQPYTISNVSLNEVIKKIIKEKELEHSARTIKIIFECKSEFFVVANEFELSRIFSNIINNSVEASSDTVSIIINVYNDEKRVTVKISDSGVGIPNNIVKNIGKFGFSFGKNNFGSGLGIYSAVRALRIWNADLEVSSRESVGTVVTMRFPRNDTNKHSYRTNESLQSNS